MSEAIDFAAMANEAAAAQDFTQTTEGKEFKKELPDAGICLLRLREYIEMGLCSCASKTYPDKKPAKKARFVFEVVTPRHVKTVVNEQTKEETRIAPSIAVTCPISDNVKSNFIKLFKQLNWDGKLTHPAQALGRGYLAEIIHAGESKGEINKDNPAKYANIQRDGVYTLQPPRKVDALAGTSEDLAVPELINPKKMFLWDKPNKACWDSLYIDGTYTKGEGDKAEEVSKNWIQEMLMEALDFEGSPLYQMLNGGELDLPTSAPTEEVKQAAPATDPLADPLAGVSAVS